MLEQDRNENNAEYKVIYRTSLPRLIFLGLVVITPAITPGMSIGFSAVALPQLKLNIDEASWFGSIASVATPIGNLFTGCIIDKYGRRTSLIISIIPSILGWALLSSCQSNLTELYIARMLTGFALGAISLPSTVYAAECIAINSIYWRSSLSTWTTIALSTGILFSYVFGALLEYNEVAYVACAISILSLLMIFFFIPESPAWLFRKGRIGDAELAQKQLGISQPILLNQKYHQRNTVTQEENQESKLSLKYFVEYIAKIKRLEVYKPLLITICFLFFLQFSGINCVIAYMVTVIKVDSIFIDPYLLSVISGLLQIIGLLCLVLLIPIFGIKFLSIVSLLGMSVGYLCLGISIWIKNYAWKIFMDHMHIFSVWFIIIMASIGMLAIPFSILGEIFPMGAKGYASLSLIVSSTFNFIILKIFLPLYSQYGCFVYFSFSLVCLCGVIFVSLFLPETVGKTVEEIRNGFKEIVEM